MIHANRKSILKIIIDWLVIINRQGVVLKKEHMKEINYFIRHTTEMGVSKNDIQNLYDNKLIGIHFDSDYEGDINKLKTTAGYDGSENEKTAKIAIKYLRELAKNGGYIWCDYSAIGETILGYIAPSDDVDEAIKLEQCEPAENKDKIKNHNQKLVLKCLKLTETIDVDDSSYLFLKAKRPMQGTFCHWHACDKKLKPIFKGNFKIENWSDLSVDQQEVLVFKFLSDESKEDKRVLPSKFHIKMLLMPIGRTLKDVDIYGVNNDGKKVFCQVTNYGYNSEKVEALEKYSDDDFLIYAGVDVCKNKIKERIGVDNFLFLDCEKVFEWAKSKGLIKYFEF